MNNLDSAQYKQITINDNEEVYVKVTKDFITITHKSWGRQADEISLHPNELDDIYQFVQEVRNSEYEG